jgi:hypothetical protein
MFKSDFVDKLFNNSNSNFSPSETRPAMTNHSSLHYHYPMPIDFVTRPLSHVPEGVVSGKQQPQDPLSFDNNLSLPPF